MANLIDEARKIINEVDAEMAKLFVKRMRAAEMVAEFKKEHGMKILDPVREAEVVKKNSALVDDEVLREYYVSFLQNNMAVSRAYQDRLISGMKIAYCGTEGAYAHIASSRLYPTARKIAYSDFLGAYKAVESGECDVCVLPIENSLGGDVGQVTDLMFSGTLYINGITELSVEHTLVGCKGASRDTVKEVVSHPQALGQCSEFLHERGYLQHEYANTALAARYVAEKGDVSIAAIASKEAAEIFGLEIIETNISQTKTNTTRFAVFSRSLHEHKLTEMGVHTVMLFTVRNEAGALAKAIDVIGKHGFNMRTLRSRPMKELLWQYYFYVEAEGNIYTSEGTAMLEELELYCDRLKPIGTYIKQ